ncbi:MAG TPA: LpqB family beta-propeller domain-containing protein, partial [Chloroflexota bacterium]|nr:LpqB family beta-propeller domain-containing protein [Chloroflexota bacterium]
MRRRPFAQYLQARSANGAGFSPDGETLAFLTDITGVPQLWTVPAAGGWPDQRTFGAERVAGLAYAPVGDRLLFQMDTGGDERIQLYLLEDDGTRLSALTEAPGVIHQFGGWSPDGRRVAYANNARHTAFFDLYLRDLDAAQPVCILEHDSTNYAGPWRPDGNSVLVSRFFTAMHNQLLLLNLTDGAAHPLTDPERVARYTEPCWSADGSTIYVLSDEGRDTMALAGIEAGSGKLDWIRASDWDYTHLAVSTDGQRVALVENVEGYSVLRVLDTAKFDPLPLPTLPAGVILDMAWRPDGTALAVTISGATRNANVWLVPLDGTPARQITHGSLAGIPRASLAE